MRTHLNVLAVLYLIGSIGELLAAMIVFGAMAVPGVISGDLVAFSVLLGIGSFVGFFLLVLALPGLFLAWGLWTRRSWARPLGFVLGVLNLFNPPLGTLLGIYTMWVLMKDEARIELESHGSHASYR